MPSEETMWSLYEDLGLLGWGAYSKVKKARHRLTGIPVAIKVLEKGEERFLRVGAEVDILKGLQHPHVVSLVQVVDTQARTYLVLERCRRTLLRHMDKTGVLREDEARAIFAQLLQALRHCHRRGVAHRDLKADNVMLDATGRAVLIDFGLATTFRPGEKLTRLCGAYTYLAPEIFLQRPYEGPKKDMWAAGVLLFFMVTGRLPFDYTSLWELKLKVVHGDYDIPETLSPALQEVLSLLLEVDPEHRPTAEEILEHPWLRQGDGASWCPPETLPGAVDARILSAMELVGFDIRDTRQSVLERRFDHTMATYCLYLSQARGGKGGVQAPDPATFPGTTPFPTPTHAEAFSLPPKRSRGGPALGSFSSSSPHQPQPSEGQPEILSPCRPGSVPNIPLCCPRKMPTASTVPQVTRPRSAPSILCPNMGPGPQTTPGAPICDTHSPNHTPDPAEQLESNSQEERAAFSQRRGRGWRGWPRRIINCIRRFCLRRPFQNTHPFRNRVVPVHNEATANM